MALSVPLSRFTSRVGGGSHLRPCGATPGQAAFFVRRKRAVRGFDLQRDEQKCLRKSSSQCFSPCSVSTTDLALPTGSRIIPFLCSRSIASQSCPFHARPLSWIVRKRSASTISSTLSLSYSMRSCYHFAARASIVAAK